MRRTFVQLLALVVLVLGLGRSALGQGIDGTLRGEVHDQSGAVVPGAQVTVTNEQTGLTRSMEATSVGAFNFPNLLAGTYTVTVEFRGFKKYVRRGVDVKSNQVSEVEATLEVGGGETVVEVSAAAEIVQTTTSNITDSFGSRQVTELPNFATQDPGGNPLNLAVLLAGVTSQPGGVEGEGGAIGGNRPRNNNFVLDGVDNNNVSVTGSMQPVIPDAVEEFTVLTNQFSAEYGHSTAGQFIVTTKSGGNDLHGSAWWFGQNKNLDALDNLTAGAIERGDISEKPRRDYNRAGGTLGGPLQKDKWFLFGAFQSQIFGQSGIATVRINAPTAAGYSTLASIPGISQVALDVLQTYVPPAANAAGTVLVGGEEVQYGPLGVAVETPFRQYDWQLNMDYTTSQHRFSGRFLYNRNRTPNTFQGIFPDFVGAVTVDYRSAQFSDVFTITPRLVNELRAGLRRYNNAFTVPSITPPGALDFFPNIEIDDLNLNIGPESNSPQSAIQNTYQLVDQVSYSRGAHTIKAGVDLRNWISPGNFLPRERGEYDWATLNSFMFDQLPDGRNGALRGVGSGFFAGNQHAVFGFLQDDWRIHPRFTLNLGLRYEWVSVARDAGLQSINSLADVPGVLVFSKPKSDRNNWGPRIGFAWDPWGDHKTAIRGGFAVAYDQIFQNLPSLQLPPQLQSELNPGTVCLPTFPSNPGWCPAGPGFMANGGLPNIFLSPELTAAEARSLTQSYIPDQVNPKTLSWSLAFQRELPGNWSVELRYVGTRGLSLPMQIRRNAQIPISMAAGAGTSFGIPVGPLQSGSLPVFGDSTQVPANMSGALTLADLCENRDVLGIDMGLFDATATCFRPMVLSNSGFDGGYITSFDPVGTSTYHGGSAVVERRMGRGLQLRGSYTWSKTIDLITNELFTSYINPRRVYDHLNLRNNRGLSDLDRTHHFALSWVWEVPKYKGSSRFVRGLLDEWKFSGAYIAESGQPFTVLSPDDVNGNLDYAGDRAWLNPAGAANRGASSSWVCVNGLGDTSIVGQYDPSCSASQVVGYVSDDPTARYIAVGPGVEINLGKNTLRSPGINNWGLGFLKNTYWNEEKGRYVQFRFEMFNAFNHPQHVVGGGSIFRNFDNGFNYAYATASDPAFLDKTSFSSGNRFIQFGLKVIF